ncbi:MAG: hypothetical protein R3F34_08310 [Planctomycetota bacterium]
MRADDGPYVRAVRTDVFVASGPVELVLPGSGTLTGRVVAPDGAVIGDVDLRFVPR